MGLRGTPSPNHMAVTFILLVVLALTGNLPPALGASPSVVQHGKTALLHSQPPESAPPIPSLPRSEEDKVPMVFPYENRVTALMYHHLTAKPEGGSSMSVETFREQMHYLKTGGFNVISMHDFAAYLRGEATLPPKAVLLTFDDGYESLYTCAFPILKEFGFPATPFVIVAHVGTIAPGGTAPHLSWEQMLELQRSGLVTFGSHTYDQHFYTLSGDSGVSRPALVAHRYDEWTGLTETDGEYDKRVYEDLLLSKRLLEQHLGVTVNSLAFPYGASTPIATELAKKAGFEFMFTTKKGIITKHSGWTELRRINAGSDKVTVPALADSIGEAVFDSMTTWFRANG